MVVVVIFSRFSFSSAPQLRLQRAQRLCLLAQLIIRSVEPEELSISFPALRYLLFESQTRSIQESKQ